MGRWGILILAVSLSCSGEDDVFRALEIDALGVAPNAVRIVAAFFGGEASSCTDARELRSSGGGVRRTWTRDEPERRLQLPEVGAEAGVLLVWEEDANGAPVRCGCRVIRYADVESGSADPIVLSADLC
ncbi:MAG: hypothetical protein HC923_09405 [Myxococcales bacterium]|nr:hypothetical protein [Myxococcales bacterium]